MRFLAIDKPTAAMSMLPPDVLGPMMEASFAKIQQLREERKILEMYTSPTGHSFVILDYNSADEWIRDKMAIPILNYMDNQIYPLADGMASMKAMIESMRAMAK